MTDEKINVKYRLVDKAEMEEEHSPLALRLKFQGFYEKVKEKVSKDG